MDASVAGDNESVAPLAVDYWKLLRTCERLVADLPADKLTRFAAQIRYSSGRLDQHLVDLEIQLSTFEGQLFGPELPVVAVNGDEVAGIGQLTIESAVEPAVIVRGRVVQPARVIVREGNSNVSGD